MHVNFKRGLVPVVVALMAMTFAQGAIAQTNLNAAMTVDNEFIAYISTDDAMAGTQIGSGNDWAVTDTFSTALTPGVTNYLHIEAINVAGPAPNPAMFIGEFTLDNLAFRFANGTQSLLTETTNWQVSDTGFGANYAVHADLGADGTAPWGNTADVDDAARFLWHPDGAAAVPNAFFSAEILPTLADLAVSVVKNHTDPVIAGAGSSDWTFTVTNNGPDATTNIVAGLSASTTGGIYTTTGCTYTASQGGPVTWPTWNVGALASGASATLQEVCPANADSTDGVNREVTLSITSQDFFDPDATNNAASVDATVAREFDLGVTAADNPDPVVAGSGAGNLTHTLTLSRSGPSDAAGVEVNVTPTLPAGVTIDGAVASVGSWAGTTWTVGDWAASENGNDQTLTITLTVDSSASVCTQCITLDATVSAASGTDTGPDSNNAVESTSIIRESTFNVTKTWADEGAGEVDVTLTCNDVVVDSATTSGGSAELTVTDFADDTACVVEETVPAGFSPTYSEGCSADPTVSGTVNDCGITNSVSRATFAVSKTYSDGNTDEVEVTLTCNNGLPLEQSFTISEGNPVVFVLTNFIHGEADCEVTETGTAAGYTPSYDNGTVVSEVSCVFDDILSEEHVCTITNTANPATYTVLKDWVVTNSGGDEVVFEANVTITCDREITGGTQDQEDDSWSKSGTLGDGQTLVATVDVTTGSASCSASEAITQSGVESTSENCDGTSLSAGGSHTCTFTNTVFFEGIPTLNQYGMALMALLMLGLGFVGLRRFV